MTAPILDVLDAGLFTTIQDSGRFGHQRYGVSVSGAADPLSLAIANHLVGNAAGAAALELTMTGGLYAVLADRLLIALSGAAMPLEIDGRIVPPYETHVVRRGERIGIGPARAGLRAYLAVGGGIDVPPVLGSRSTHSRTGLGGLEGRALRTGDRLPGAPATIPRRLRLPADRRPYFGGVVPAVPGPQADAFEPAAFTILTQGRYRLSSRSDRMGCLLDGPPLPFAEGFNIVSDGIAAGSIQVPGHGRPLVLLADRQTTGGYPKIATVTVPGLCRLVQRRPNERVVFHIATPAEAEESYLAWRRWLADLPNRLQPA